MGWYPKRKSYYADMPKADEEIEQGDILWGVPSLIARHPDLVNRFQDPLQKLADAEDLELPSIDRVISGVSVMSDPVIVLPHTCDFYGPEKGRTNRVRLVGRIQRLADSGIRDLEALRSGEGYIHTFFLPSWKDPARDSDDMFLNMRYMTSVDAAYLSRKRRVARLGPAAVIALRRRLAHFFTDYAPMPKELVLAEELGGLVRGDRDPIG